MESGNQIPVDRHQSRADQVLAMARRHAEEIRAAAEEEADRVLQEAERETMRRRQEQLEADRLREEQLEADRRERTRLGVQRQQIEECLDTTAVAVARIRELVSSLPNLDSSPGDAGSPGSQVSALTVATADGDNAGRRRMLDRIAIVLAIWAIFIVVTLVFVSQRQPDAEPSATVASQDTTRSDAVPAAASAASAAPAPLAPPIAAPSSAKTNLSTVPASQELGLTVAFVATRDCWISIASDDGASVDRLLKASEKYVVRARDVVTFKAGNAAALSVLINDQPTGPLGAEGKVVTRRITRANYKSFLLS